jgi:hypothetical protein
MGITKDDYAAFMLCLSGTLDTFAVPEPERGEVKASSPACNRRSSRYRRLLRDLW